MCIAIAILGDALVEGNELFNVVLNSALSTVEFFPQTATVTILDNDSTSTDLELQLMHGCDPYCTKIVCVYELNS